MEQLTQEALNDEGGPARRRRRIKALVEASDCLTYTEIGKRVGVSRERVRQIARQYGYKGRERIETCSLSKRRARVMSRPEIVSLRRRCEVHDIGLDLLPKAGGGGFHSRVVLLNGYRCPIISLTPRLSNRRFYVIHPPERKGDFVLAYNPEGDIWMVIPAGQLPGCQTMFTLGHIGNRGNNISRHDWPRYREAWHLLKDRGLVSRAANGA